MSQDEKLNDTSPASCGTCVFPIWFQNMANGHGGFCRRNPPVPLLKMSLRQTLATQQPKPHYEVVPQFPPTTKDNWCGEHLTPDEFAEMRMGDDAPIV